jgi:murein DD-endopeptidase MepM/ murein hydrolase activator NlpD
VIRIQLSILLVAMAARAQGLELHGQIREGGLLIAQIDRRAHAEVDGHGVRVSASGHFLIGLAPGRRSASILVRSIRGAAIRRRLDVPARSYPTRRLSGLAHALIDPTGALLAREQRGASELGVARRRDTEFPYFEAGFAMPLHGTITSRFGVHRTMNGRPGDRHWAVDIGASTGAAVRAPGEGIVTFVGELPIEGRMVLIDHGHGLTSSLLHLSEIRASRGQHVRRGEIVAAVGSTGRVTGPHLDWRVSLFGEPLDPLLIADDNHD